MKIAVFVDEKEGWDSSVSLRLGDTPYVAIYDTDSKKLRFIENPYTFQRGGVVWGLAMKLRKLGVKLVIVGREHKLFRRDFEREGLDVKVCKPFITLKEALEQFGFKIEE